MDNKFLTAKNFQLNVTIIEARHLPVSNVDTVAIVSVGSHRKRTKAKTKRTQHPYFNFLFTFSFCELLDDLLQFRLRLGIHETKCNKLIGLCDIELMTIWNQLGHQFQQKWAVLTDPRDPFLGLKGYLKCDIELIEEGVRSTVPNINGENSESIEGNLMVPMSTNFRRQNAVFCFNLYRADGITFRKEQLKKETIVPCRKLYVKVHFAGKTVKTKVSKGIEPRWNQALPLIEAVPSLFQTIVFELWDKKVGLVGTTSLFFNELCNHTDIGATPSFGPAFIYVYQHHKRHPTLKYLSGRILISLTCELIDKGNPVVGKTPTVAPLDEKYFGTYNYYTLFLAIRQCIFFQKSYSKECQISVNHGTWFVPNENQSHDDDVEGLRFSRKAIEFEDLTKVCKSYYAWHSQAIIPAIETSCRWPQTDYREKQSNHCRKLLTSILEKIQELHNRKSYRKLTEEETSEVARTLENGCEEILALPPYPSETKLDTARRIELRELLRQIHKISTNHVHTDGRSVDEVLLALEDLLNSALELTKDLQKTFPEIEIVITKQTSLNKKASVVMKAEEVLYSRREKERGIHCGKVQTLFLENGRGCEVAALDVFIWFGQQCFIPEGLKMLTGSKPEEVAGTIIEIEINDAHIFDLRVHIYQARINPGLDDSGLADPFVRVLAFGKCQETQVKAQTLDPIWDETLIFSGVKVVGDPRVIKKQSVGVVFEVLDFDGAEVYDLVGRSAARPVVTLSGENYVPAKLRTHVVSRCREATAEILLSMELIEVDDEKESDFDSARIYAIPEEIRPHLRPYELQVIFWGIRNYKVSWCWPPPKIMGIIECNGEKVESQMIRYGTCTNFEYQKQCVELYVPQESDYVPPITFGLYEFSAINRASYKGGAIIPYVSAFITDNVKPNMDCIELDFESDTMETSRTSHVVELDDRPDWWSKYYASRVLRTGKSLKIYSSELEAQPEFHCFQDILQSIELKRGKINPKKKNTQESIGVMKCHIKLSALDEKATKLITGGNGYFRTNPIDITVRVYIVAAIHLTPTDLNGRCDPYISLSFGKTKISDRKNYVYKDTDPTFGKCYELHGTFPWDHTLHIKVMDHDLCISDDLIGETFIDIENRFYTKHRACCGLPTTYESSGAYKWRDIMEPTEILSQICSISNLPAPQYTSDHVSIGQFIIKRHAESRNDVALRILNNFHNIPDYGYALVPEYIETRRLYHPKKPIIDQGRLEMWVDVFPGHGSLPPAVDIAPRQPEKLELRLIVWNTADVLSSDFNLLTMEESIDVYVLGWLTSNNQTQRTDIHYRSLTGEGAFNWRFIFPFLYSPSDRKMIIHQKVSWSEGLEKEKIPPKLELQVWDNDLLIDDFIGSLTLDLSNMPRGANSAKKCTLKIMEADQPRVSLFKLKKMRGWWPFRGRDSADIIAGKIDLELEIFSQEQARCSPAGLGRDGPQALPEPKRPGTSSWLPFAGLSPLGLIKSLFFGNMGKKLMISSAIACFVVFFVSGWLSIPGILIKKVLDPS